MKSVVIVISAWVLNCWCWTDLDIPLINSTYVVCLIDDTWTTDYIDEVYNVYPSDLELVYFRKALYMLACVRAVAC